MIFVKQIRIANWLNMYQQFFYELIKQELLSEARFDQ